MKYEVNQSIFNVNNKYGYRLNVNHPKINELYRRFKVWKGYAMNFPLTDEQRFEFESYILEKYPPLNE